MKTITLLEDWEKGHQVLVDGKLSKTLSDPRIEWMRIPSPGAAIDAKAYICIKFFRRGKGPIAYAGVLERIWHNKEGHQCWEMTKPKVEK